MPTASIAGRKIYAKHNGGRQATTGGRQPEEMGGSP